MQRVLQLTVCSVMQQRPQRCSQASWHLITSPRARRALSGMEERSRATVHGRVRHNVRPNVWHSVRPTVR
jgi:hypothetical protein